MTTELRRSRAFVVAAGLAWLLCMGLWSAPARAAEGVEGPPLAADDPTKRGVVVELLVDGVGNHDADGPFTPVSDEPGDYVPVTMTIKSAGISGGTFTLEAVGGGTVCLWDEGRTTPWKSTWDLGDGETVARGRVQGLYPSGVLRDVVFSLTYSKGNATGDDVVEGTCMQLQIWDQDGHIGSDTRVRSAGQLIGLMGKVVPEGIAATGWQWTVPHHVVKSYQGGTQKPVAVELLSDVDKQISNPAFYWVDGGPHNVSATCQARGKALERVAAFSVCRPWVDSFEGLLGAWDCLQWPDEEQYGDRAGRWELFFGSPLEGTAGLDWCAYVTPNGFPGRLKYVQTVRSTRTRTASNNGAPMGALETATTTATPNPYWLDKADPYDQEYTLTTSEQATMDGPESLDTPGQLLDVNYMQWSVDLDYRLYVMFKPETDGIWIPLAILEWGGSASVASTDDGATWEQGAGGAPQTRPDEPGHTVYGGYCEDFPEWPDIATALPRNPDYE